MKKTFLLLAALAMLVLSALSGCVDTGTPAESTADTAAETTSETTATAETRTDAALRAHYEALATTLRTELAAVREEAYITRETLLARIRALEAALESLGVEIPEAPPSETLPPSTEPDTTAAVTTPSTDTTAPPTHETASPFRYTLENGEATLTAYISDGIDDTAVTIPAALGGCPVTRIGDNAFAGTKLERITLPPTVTIVGWFAFAGCHDLTAITIPASVIRIDYGAFDGCPSLTIHAPAGSYAAGYAASFGIPHTEA